MRVYQTIKQTVTGVSLESFTALGKVIHEDQVVMSAAFRQMLNFPDEFSFYCLG